VVAIDFATSMVNATAERTGGKIPIIRASADAVPQREASFDLVLALDVIEHLYEPGRALDEIRRVLRPRGTLLLATDRDGVVLGDLPHRVHRITRAVRRHTPAPLRRTLNRVVRRGRESSAGEARGTAQDPNRYLTPLCTHTHEFPLPELLELARAHGFEPTGIDTYPHRTGYGRWGQVVERFAIGPLKRYKWNYVMIRLQRAA